MRVLLVIVMLAGCSAAPVDELPTGPIHDGEAPPALQRGPDNWYDCDNVTVPEAWYGHADGSLWCVREAGPGGASGTAVTPVTTLQDAYSGWNGSVGHDPATPIEGHVFVRCWAGACLADVTLQVYADGAPVASLQVQEVVVDAILLDGVWLDLSGTLDAKIPKGAVLSIAVEVSGAGPALLLGYSGNGAPWIEIG